MSPTETTPRFPMLNVVAMLFGVAATAVVILDDRFGLVEAAAAGAINGLNFAYIVLWYEYGGRLSPRLVATGRAILVVTAIGVAAVLAYGLCVW
jgi:hypothetical protein